MPKIALCCLGTMLTAVVAASAAPSFDHIDTEIAAAIARGELPGAVVLIQHKDEIIYRKAHGSRSTQPRQEPATVDTVYDLASLTKPVATATSIFVLLEQGKLK